MVNNLYLVTPRGFCAGVEMAIKALTWMLKIYDETIYCYHEIVHNDWIVERFKTKNIEKACLKELSEQITFLEEHPLTRQIRYKNIRIHLFKKFNYSFHYVVIDNEVRILHFLNQKQNF